MSVRRHYGLFLLLLLPLFSFYVLVRKGPFFLVSLDFPGARDTGMWNFGNWRIHTYAYCFRIHLFYGSLVFKAKSCFLFFVRPETQRAYKMTESLVRIPFCILYVLQQKDSFPTAHLPEAEQLRYDADR
ncbi:uncharacterized protein TrAFT101_003919 [Trichoderma asperellum]|uniref:uncharacterized protein n=1 Tax=Trichoderma asperellum TaxID=101201 RepID=UPI0033255BE2|nr:hypothetical protein TrAFT101_003919 [Trichoderma asperellum]